MLLRNSAAYLLARGFPGILNFAALALYSRVLSPDSYGKYAIVIAGVTIAYLALYQWITLCVSRFVQQRDQNITLLLSNILFLFVAVSIVIIPLALGFGLLFSKDDWAKFLIFAVPYLLVYSLFDLSLILTASKLSPKQYGQLNLTRSLLALPIGYFLAIQGFGAWGPLLGLLIGYSAAWLVFGRSLWHGVALRVPSFLEVAPLLRYGLPLATTFALAWVVDGSDRLLLSWLKDTSAVGHYAVGYDLAQQSSGLILNIVHLAAYPLAVKALEGEGEKAACSQLRLNGELVVTLALVVAAGQIALAPQISQVLVGADFRASTSQLLPYIAVAAAFSSIKIFYLDSPFHLGRWSMGLLWITAFAAIVNFVLNLFLIPHIGIMGAAYATIVAFLIGAIASAWFGKRVMEMPAMMPIFAKGLGVAAISGSAAYWCGFEMGLWGLVSGVFAGALGALLAALALNVADTRKVIGRWLVAAREHS